mmetsp:Transcript_29963/g.29488  ORF Transcript_29963/g.29488 Transcript_29963/m.29488 type:complete len:153 (-) Transcript_29963:37-495(-)
MKESDIMTLPRMIFENIPSRSNDRNRVINLAYSGSQNDSSDPPTQSVPLQSLINNLLLPYITKMMNEYLRFQSDLQQLLSEYSFRSPLNFLMVKHDFDIFVHEFMRCEAKLKFGLKFIQQHMLAKYGPVGNLTDQSKEKYDIGYRFLVEKDN